MSVCQALLLTIWRKQYLLLIIKRRRPLPEPSKRGIRSSNLKFNEPKSNDLVQVTLEMLTLKTLALEPMHGYGVALRIEQVSSGVFRVNPGSLLPALSRMERTGQIRSECRATENNRRAKYYMLTPMAAKSLPSRPGNGTGG